MFIQGLSGAVKLRNYKIKRKKQGTLFGCVEDLSYLCRHYWTIDHRRCSNSEDGKVFGTSGRTLFPASLLLQRPSTSRTILSQQFVHTL